MADKRARSLTNLATTRPTQLSPATAMRAREIAVPTADDLAEAANDLVIVRKHYVPPEPLRTSRGKRSRTGSSRR